jgi:hypothetical protein
MSAARQWLGFTTLALQLSQAVLLRFAHKFFAPTLHAAAIGGLCVAQGVSTSRLARVGSVAAVEPALAPLLGTETGAGLFDVVALRQPLAGAHAVERVVGPSASAIGLAVGGSGGGFHRHGSNPGRCVLSGALRSTRSDQTLRQAQPERRWAGWSRSAWWPTGVRATTRRSCRRCWPKPGRGCGCATCMRTRATTPNGCMCGVGNRPVSAVGSRWPCGAPTVRREDIGARRWRAACRLAMDGAGRRKASSAP